MNTPVFDTDLVFDSALFGGDAPLFDEVVFDLNVFDTLVPLNARVYWVETTIPKSSTSGFLGSLVKVWNGSAFINGYAKYWDGAAWQPAQLKRWSGSVWENIP